MKKIFFSFLVLSILLAGIFISCEKEISCEGEACKENNKPPIAVAGPDQSITLPTDSISLDGSSSNDPDGRISEWLWKKISGPASFNISTASIAKTVVRNLDTGVYRFELKVTDDKNLSATDTVQITVNKQGQPANRPPVANAGVDQTINLPTNGITLDGGGSTDPDNNITNYAWTKISGPSSFSIANTNAVQTQVTNLVEGVYQFELKVTDAGGLFSKDTMQVTINTPVIPCNNLNWPIINATLSPIGTLSEPRIPQGGAIGNKVVFAGGSRSEDHLPGINCGEVTLGSDVVDIYDINSHLWSTTHLSKAREGMSVVNHGNKMFFAGGYSWDFITPITLSYLSYDNVDIYDVSTNTWEAAHLSEARMGIASAAVGNKVLFAGGTNYYWNGAQITHEPSNTVDIYDMVTDSWSTATLSVAGSELYAVALNDKIYFAGGYGSNTVDIYNNSTNTWTVSGFQAVIASLAPPQGMGFIDKFDVKGDNIIYWSGQNQVGIRNLTTGTTTVACLEDRAPAYFVNNSVVFFLPGFQFHIYNPASNVWSSGIINPALPSTLSVPRVISLNNTIYIGGGYNAADNNSCGYGNRVFSLSW